MSVSVMGAVWKSAPYSGSTLLTLLALADWSSDEGICWPKVETLAKKARLGIRCTQNALRKLQNDKAISVVKDSNAPGQGRVYQLGVQYLHPSFPQGCKVRQKGCSTRHANKEEPSLKATVKTYCEKCKGSGLRKSYFSPGKKVACECREAK